MAQNNKGLKASVQKLGSHLSGMVMPNIGAFIAWGIITALFIEPAKILFLNNAINHGILTPLGTQQVAEAGKSILYLLEANPGPGLGVLPT
ncbi:hypothetical protein [Fundicoccus ignavus]|uniref:hypothetical protein n=1 Tax=Fundicoccus ignavus TaxID=2664442 RepID=UPI00345A0101